MDTAWTGDLIGRMHNAKVTRAEIASVIGVKPAYVTMILNGRRCPPGIRARMEAAFDAIVEKRGNEGL